MNRYGHVGLSTKRRSLISSALIAVSGISRSSSVSARHPGPREAIHLHTAFQGYSSSAQSLKAMIGGGWGRPKSSGSVWAELGWDLHPVCEGGGGDFRRYEEEAAA